MKTLIVSFSVNGVLGDNLRLITKYLTGAGQNISVLTNVGTQLNSNPGFDVVSIPFDRKRPFDFVNPVSFYKIRKYLRNNKFDAVIFLSFHPANLFIFRLIPSQKILFYVHDHDPHSGFSKFDLLFLKPQYDFIYKQDVTLLVSSEFMKNEILSKHKNIDNKKIRVIYLGLLENLTFPKNENIEEDIDVLFFGRIEYYKALDTLVESYKTYDQKYSCVIIGKGDLNIFGIDQLPDGIIHINDYVSDLDLAKFIQRSKMVVMPYRDATGTQVIQTVFYYGKPIVATNVGCFPEYIENGKCGLIVEKENPELLNAAINKLLADKNLRTAMGKNAAERVKQIFSNDAINESYINALKSVAMLNNL